MDRVAELQRITRCIEAAAAKHDWAAVLRIERDLPKSFGELTSRGPWSPSEHRMLEALQVARNRVLEQCAQAAAELEQRIAGLRLYREGWLAYADHDKDKDS